MVNGTQLMFICPSLSQTKANEIAGLLDSVCPKYGIDTADKLHEFIARLAVESGEFTRFTEGLNYQAVALTKKFSRERISVDDCYRYGRTAKQQANQRAIANCIYGGVWGKKNLGNIFPDDGWTFRGSGSIQLTGRAIVTAFTDYYNKKFGASHTPVAMADLLRNNLSINIHGACWFFSVYKNLIQLAVDDKINTIVKRINGGFNGLAETKVYLQRAEQIIK